MPMHIGFSGLGLDSDLATVVRLQCFGPFAYIFFVTSILRMVLGCSM